MNYLVVVICIEILLWIIVSIFLKNRQDRADKIFLIVSFIIIFVTMAIREPYSDMNNYLTYFYYFNNCTIEQFIGFDLEPLFKIYLWILGRFSQDASFFIAMTSLITLIGPYFYIKQNSKNYLLSIIMFISFGTFYMQFFIIRQAIAISIFLLSIKSLKNRKIIQYVFLIILATLFHKSAIILLLVYPFVNIRNKKIKTFFMVMSAMAMMLCRNFIITFLSSQIGYDSYLSSSKYGVGGGLGMLLISILIVVLGVIINKKHAVEEEYMPLMLSIFYIFLQAFALDVALICRLANYTKDGLSIYLPNIVQTRPEKERFLYSTIIICSCIIFALIYDPTFGYNIIL